MNTTIKKTETRQSFSALKREVANSYCKQHDISFDQFTDDYNLVRQKILPVEPQRDHSARTVRRMFTDTYIDEYGEIIKNPNHTDSKTIDVEVLYQATKDTRLLEYLPQKYGGIVVWENHKTRPTVDMIFECIKRLVSIMKSTDKNENRKLLLEVAKLCHQMACYKEQDNV